MKNISKLVFSLLLVSFIVPNLALASWWNPFSWFRKNVSTKNEITKIVTPTSTTTTITSIKNEDVKTLDNSTIIKAEVEKQVQAALKAKIDEEAKIAQQKNYEQSLKIAQEKAIQDALNLEKQKTADWLAEQTAKQAAQEAANLASLQAAQLQANQNAANLAAQQQASQDATNRVLMQAQNEKKAKLDAINKQIADLNMKYANDIANIYKTPCNCTTAVLDGRINQINRQYNIDYNLLSSQYQQVQYSN